MMYASVMYDQGGGSNVDQLSNTTQAVWACLSTGWTLSGSHAQEGPLAEPPRHAFRIPDSVTFVVQTLSTHSMPSFCL